MSELPNPFLTARKDCAIHAAIELRDVQAIRPQWDEQQARTFLERNSAIIGNTMLMAGVEVLRQLVEAHEHDH